MAHSSVSLETPIEFINITPLNPLISKCQIKVCYVQDTPNRNGSIITEEVARKLANSLPGSTIEFDPLIVNFLCDKDLRAWLDIYKWMLSLNNYITHESKAWHPKGRPEAVTLHILDNNKDKIVMSIHYYGAWPSDLSEIQYSYKEDSDPAINATATFNFKSFAVEIDGIIIEGRPQIDSNAAMQQEIRSKSMHPSMRNV